MKHTANSQYATSRRLRGLAAVPIAFNTACDKSISFTCRFFSALCRRFTG
jgi:hypothetical protein